MCSACTGESSTGFAMAGPVDSIGVDSWAVDYGLLDADGRLLGNPVHYRDTRTDGVMQRVLRDLPAEELYAATGLQLLPFNTIFQLVAARDTAQSAAARTLLLIPDLIAYWLTGQIGAERTNASTTQLLDVRDGNWSVDLAARLGIRLGILPPLREPGERIGLLDRTARARTHAGHRRRARTTPPRRSSACPPRASGSPTSPAAHGLWSGVELELAGAVRRKAGWPTSPTRSASTAPCATCAT